MKSTIAHRLPIGLLASAVAAAACGEADRPSAGPSGGTIVVSSAADADALIPPLVAGLQGRQVTELIFDHLADIGADINVMSDKAFTPRLAERWTWSDDSTAISFHIDPRARWHDGKPVRAGDVRFTFGLYTDSLVASPLRPLLTNIDSVTVTDSLTARFWYARRSPLQFSDAAYQLLIVPEHLLDTVPRADLRRSAFARNPVGSGRFRFSRWVPGTSVEIVADTANYRGRARVDRVIWTISPDFNAASTRFFAGEADVFEFLRPEQLGDVARDSTLRVVTYPGLDYAFVQFNLRDQSAASRPHPLFADRELRRALSMAVDRAALVRSVFDSLAVVSFGPSSRAIALADSTVPQLPFDRARAARTLDSLGWKDSDGDGIRSKGGRELAFTLLVPSSSRSRTRMATLLQEQLRTAGVRLELEQLDYGAFTERLNRRRFDAAFGAWHIDAGPAGIRQTWGSRAALPPTGMNFGFYQNATFDAHVDTALTSMDLPTSRAHFRAALETIVEDAPAIWMYEVRGALGHHRRIRPTGIRSDAWWGGLADWTIPEAERIDRDRIGLTERR